MTPRTAPLEAADEQRISALTGAWQSALDGLRPASPPVGEPLPLDLHTVVYEAQASMKAARRWEAMLAHVNRTPLIRDLAAQWQLSPTRVTHLGERGLNNLRVHASSQAWPDLLWALAAQPRVVTVPADCESVWPVLVTACRSHGRYDLRTVTLEAGTWALYRGPAPVDYRNVPVTPGALLSPAKAARALAVSTELLNVVWPVTQVWRTQAGEYVGHPRHWTCHDWLSLLRAAAGNQVQVTEALVLQAFRALPGVPPYQASTVVAALRHEPLRAWLNLPRGRGRRARPEPRHPNP